MAILENRVHCNRELLLTILALPNAITHRLLAAHLCSELVGGRALAVRADWAVRPAEFLKESAGLVSVLEVRSFGYAEHV
jgi:hypothetical protein